MKIIVSIFLIVAVAYIAFLVAASGNLQIVFYGRVVDAVGEPVPNAVVSAKVTRRKIFCFGSAFSEKNFYSYTIVRHTDQSGNFSIVDERGTSLYIDTINHPRPPPL